MKRVVLKGILGRKFRTILTAFAIVLGVAMVSGSYVLTDTISKAFNVIFASSYSQTDAVISGKKVVQYSQSGNALVSPDVLSLVRNVDGVGAASGEIIDYTGNSDQAKILDKQGNVITGNGNPTFGFGIDPDQPRFNPLKLTVGRWADGKDEVVIDAATADKYGFHVGDRVNIAVGGIHRFRLVGIAKFGDVASVGGATISIFDPTTARAVLNKDGFDIVSVSAKPGVSAAELIANLKPVLPSTVQVQTGNEQAKSDEQGVATFIKLIRYVLLGFGGVALFVGGFVIFNTLSITVAQRAREFATLRTLGASRRQVLRSVVLESAIIGLIASLIGLLLGLGLARGLDALFVALGIDLPHAGTVLATRTVVASLATGTPPPPPRPGAAPAGGGAPAAPGVPRPGPRGPRAAPRGAARPADRGGPRGLRRPADTVLPPPSARRGRHLAPRAGPGRRGRVRCQLRCEFDPAPARRRHDAALRRHRDGLQQPRPAPGRGRRPPCASPRRRGRTARRRERRPQHGAHGRHRRSADDRLGARHLRGDARRRTEVLRSGCAGPSGSSRLRRLPEERRHVRRARRSPARCRARRRRGLGGAHGPGACPGRDGDGR